MLRFRIFLEVHWRMLLVTALYEVAVLCVLHLAQLGVMSWDEAASITAALCLVTLAALSLIIATADHNTW